MTEINTCEICTKSSDNKDDVLLYGEWMKKQGITVHYFCLLLSSHLPQRGGDSTGMLGFLMRDIRIEINAAKNRTCVYCKKTGASISCFECHLYWHLECSLSNHCVSYFCDDFRSYCEKCTPTDAYKMQLSKSPPENALCAICVRLIGNFNCSLIVYGECCRLGFTHRICMQRYALASGYYLRCIWCRSKEFRDTIKKQSIFVPDRDAEWELEQNAFRELHTMNIQCDVDNCRCPKGRTYNAQTWNIIVCKFCAAIGAHEKCISGKSQIRKNRVTLFKCVTCIEVEKRLTQMEKDKQRLNDSGKKQQCPSGSFYVSKTTWNPVSPLTIDDPSPVFSEDDTMSSHSQITVINTKQKHVLNGEDDDPIVQSLYAKPYMESNGDPILVLKSSFISTDRYFYLDVYEFNNETKQCIGSSMLRFAEDDPRINDRSPESLEQLCVKESDIWYRDDDKGVFAEIDKFIESSL